MIPDRLNDNFTSFAKQNKKHTTLTHLGCVLLRIILGLLIYFKLGINNSFLYVLFILVIIFFSYKLYITKNKTWKVYIRTILVYTSSLILTYLDNKQSRNISGILIIIDSLMGLQSRHIQNNFIN